MQTQAKPDAFSRRVAKRKNETGSRLGYSTSLVATRRMKQARVRLAMPGTVVILRVFCCTARRKFGAVCFRTSFFCVACQNLARNPPARHFSASQTSIFVTARPDSCRCWGSPSGRKSPIKPQEMGRSADPDGDCSTAVPVPALQAFPASCPGVESQSTWEQ